MLIQETRLTVPAGKVSKPSLDIDLAAILIAEQRQDEIAMVTPMKAPELLALFNGSWRNVDRIVNQLTAERIIAERGLEQRRAVLLLDEIPNILQGKGVDSTKDTRDAAIVADKNYQDLQDRVDQLTAAVAYMKGKLKSFENAFTSVKKIMGEDTYNMNGRIGNKNLSGGVSEPRVSPAPPPSNPPPSTPSGTAAPLPEMTTGWGTPRYDRR
jgi:hypothetical protein